MITPQQREARRKFVGSSDCAAIMGLDPYRSAADVWLSKTGRVEDGKENEAMEAGSILERSVLDWAEKELGSKIFRDMFIRPECTQRCANLDGVCAHPDTPDRDAIVEAKTTGITGPADPGYGEPGTDELPERVLIQVHHQFGVMVNIRTAYVPVLIGGVGFRMYKVDRNDELVSAVVEAAESFWRDFVAKDVQPDDYKPSLDVLKRMRREPGLIRVVNDETAENLIVARAARLQAEKDEEEAAAALLAEMGDAEAADFGGGKLITYRTFTRKAYEVPAGSFRRWGFPKSQKVIQEKVGAA